MRRITLATLVTLAVTLVGLVVVPASAHDLTDCLEEDPDCLPHYQNYHLEYHYSGILNDGNHSAERASFVEGVDIWKDKPSPDSPWHQHIDTNSPSHAELLNDCCGNLGQTVITTPITAENHIPGLDTHWLRNDLEEETCGSSNPCGWYTGTGAPPADEIDMLSHWGHELGHAQNITHFDPDAHSHIHTMQQGIDSDRRKRNPTDHGALHACHPYREEHSNC